MSWIGTILEINKKKNPQEKNIFLFEFEFEFEYVCMVSVYVFYMLACESVSVGVHISFLSAHVEAEDNLRLVLTFISEDGSLVSHWLICIMTDVHHLEWNCSTCPHLRVPDSECLTEV